jgi:hypothetical protein
MLCPCSRCWLLRVQFFILRFCVVGRRRNGGRVVALARSARTLEEGSPIILSRLPLNSQLS